MPYFSRQVADDDDDDESSSEPHTPHFDALQPPAVPIPICDVAGPLEGADETEANDGPASPAPSLDGDGDSDVVLDGEEEDFAKTLPEFYWWPESLLRCSLR